MIVNLMRTCNPVNFIKRTFDDDYVCVQSVNPVLMILPSIRQEIANYKFQILLFRQVVYQMKARSELVSALASVELWS